MLIDIKHSGPLEVEIFKQVKLNKYFNLFKYVIVWLCINNFIDKPGLFQREW